MPELQVPSQLGRFEVLEQIGVGLTGEVYKARDRDGTMVALKVLARARRNDPTVFGYFTNEQVLLREIARHRRHPHIVEYIASNLNQPPYYLATRLVVGARGLDAIIGDRALLAAGKPQPAVFVMRVISQIASALDYLHVGHPTYSPIVHRDVKPSNILIAADGNAVLIDFSIARHPHYALTDEKNLGTPGYMAPEQYTGEEVPASDQFALALVTLHMLTGRRPLPDRATSSFKQIERWRDTRYEDITQMLGHRIHTADVLIRALAYDPAHRYESCEAFADRLRRALAQDGEDVHEPVYHPLPAPPQSQQPAHPSIPFAWIGIGAVALIALIVLILAATTSSAGSQPALSAPAGIQESRLAPAALSPTEPAPVQPPDTPMPVVTAQSTLAPLAAAMTVTIVQREPLRARPSTDSMILAWMPEGARVERTGNEQATGALVWYEVRFNNQIGWCRSIYCQP